MCGEVKACNATTLFTDEAKCPKELAGCCIRRGHRRMGLLYSSLSTKRPMPTNHCSLWARSGCCRNEPERVRTLHGWTMMRHLRHPLFEISALCSFFCLTAACQNGRSQSGSAVSNEVVQGFQNLENTWSQAIDHRDQYALELVLAPDFLNVGI